MLFIDYFVIAALTVALIAWWRRGDANRARTLTIASLLTVAVGAYTVSDFRWQATAAIVVALLFLLVVGIGALRKKEPRPGKPWISGTFFTLLWALAVFLLWSFPVPPIPSPSGEHAVGVRTFELTDESRKGVIAAAEDEGRRLLVRVWYPAGDVGGLEPAPYMTDVEADNTARGIGTAIGMPFFFTYLKHVGTNSYEGAPILSGAETLPVVVYSHGYTSFLQQNTVLMEELASHGYIVYSIQHTYDSSPTVFPNGDVLPSDPKLIEEVREGLGADGGMPQEMKDAFLGETLDIRYAGILKNRDNARARNDRIAVRSPKIWVADRTFVLDSLQQGQVPESVADVVAAGRYTDTGQIGMSFGGSTTGGFCVADRRCAAGVNLDGGDYHFTPLNTTMPMPFLMFYSDFKQLAAQVSDDPDAPANAFNDFSYERFETAGLNPEVTRVSVTDVGHLGISDFPLFVRNPIRAPFLGGADPNVVVQAQNDFVLGFFDTYLRGIDAGFPDAQFAAYAGFAERNETHNVRDWWLAKHPEDIVERVVLEFDQGDVELALYPARAPISVANFLAHVDGGHYNGAKIYRAVDGAFGIVQGGLVADLMNLPPEEFEKFEPVLPPVAHERTDETGIRNERGTVALARMEPGTAGSEFFINLTDNLVLDSGKPQRAMDGEGYATFGRVLRGMRLLEAIQRMPTDAPTQFEPLRGQLLTEPVEIRRAYRVE